MKSFALTARARLTLVFTGLFAGGGIALVAITYLLVAKNVSVTLMNNPATDNAFLKVCANLGNNGNPLDPTLKEKCAATVKLGAQVAAALQRQSMLDDLLFYSIVTLVATTALATALGWLIAGRILRPIHRLTDAARNASENNLSQRLSFTGPRDRLESAFNAQRRFIANASHELRTPLTLMRTRLDVVLAKPTATRGDLIAMGNEVRSEIDNADVLITSLLTLARNERAQLETQALDIAAIARCVIERAEFGTLTYDFVRLPAPIQGDPHLIELLVSNLIVSAIRYNIPGGTVTISTTVVEGNATLQIANTGAVVTPDRIEEIFQPFTRLDDRLGTEGYGLGLALVDSIATAHLGTVTASAPDSGGLIVVVRFPATDSASSPKLAEGGEP